MSNKAEMQTDTSDLNNGTYMQRSPRTKVPSIQGITTQQQGQQQQQIQQQQFPQPYSEEMPISSSNQSVKVFVRARPILPHEKQEESMIEISAHDNELTVTEENYKIKQTFDKAFDQSSTQILIFKEFQEPIAKVLEGFNFTIFAYGQTGSGKTYTMFGCDWESLVNVNNNSDTSLKKQQSTFFEQLDQDINYAGIIPRTIFQLFNQVNNKKEENSQLQISVYCSFLQIYNEKIFDLLAETNALKPLAVHESKLDGIFVEGLSEYQVAHYYDTLALMKRGEKNRSIRSTSMNAKSSRSHTIFQLIVETLDTTKDKGAGVIKRARINLCDLAGSEKINKSEVMAGGHFNELRNINLSLTTLGKVIHCLSGSNKNKLPVPFRESKLTRILQESLVGNTITYIMANISPSIQNIDETVGTLKFAERARHIVMTIKPNQISSKDDENVKKLQKEVLYLKEILNMRRKGQTVNDINTRFLKLQAENEKLKKDHISIREVEKLIDDNRRMKAEIQQIYMNQSMNNGNALGSPDDKVMRSFNNIEISLKSQPNMPQSPPSDGHHAFNYLNDSTNGIESAQRDFDEVRSMYSNNQTNNTNDNNITNSISNVMPTVDSSKSRFFPNSPGLPPARGYGNRSLGSIPHKHFNSSSMNLFSNLSSQRNQFMGSDSFSSGVTPVKIRVRGRQDYQMKDGYLELSNQEAQMQEKKKKDKKRILERLDELERIQKFNQEKLQRELDVIDTIDRNTAQKKYAPALVSKSKLPPSQSEFQKQMLLAPLLDKQKKQLKEYELKIKQLERRYFSQSSK